MDEKKNSEGYPDPTAYEAIKNVNNGGLFEMPYLRGDIYYVEKGFATGSEQQSGRPAVIVSNNKCNENSDVIEIVYLTTQPKTDLPTHVTIRSTGRVSTALCEQIQSVYKARFANFIGTVTDEEMAMIENALSISLDLPEEIKTVEKVCVPDVAADERLLSENEELKRFIKTLEAKLESITAELEMKKSDVLYTRAQNDLLMDLYMKQLSSGSGPKAKSFIEDLINSKA